MENQLTTIIAVYEDEKNRLQKMLTSCLSNIETDYLSAHYYSIEISQINSKLQLLKNFEDPLYNEKCWQVMNIDFYEKRLTNEASEEMKQYYHQNIFKAKQELERLNQIPKIHLDENELTIIDNFLFKLLNNQLNKSELILNKKQNLVLQFKYSKKVLTVKIPFLKKHITEHILHEDRIESLKKMGFETTKSENALVLLCIGEKNAILNQIKSLLLKIVFEIFYYSEFKNETFLNFVEKPHR